MRRTGYFLNLTPDIARRKEARRSWLAWWAASPGCCELREEFSPANLHPGPGGRRRRSLPLTAVRPAATQDDRKHTHHAEILTRH